MHTQKRKPVRPPRVASREVTLVTQEEINQMDPKIPSAMHNISKQVEDEPLPWYLVNVFVDPNTGVIRQ